MTRRGTAELEPITKNLSWRAYSPEEGLRVVYGVRLDESTCAGCQRVFRRSDYPFPIVDGGPSCPHCGRLLGRRCLTVGCAAVIEPTPELTTRRDGSSVTRWRESPQAHCEACTVRQGESSRRALWAAHVPRHLQSFAGENFKTFAWHGDPRQSDGVRGWLRRLSRPEQESRRPSTTLYVCGPTGVGKSVALARLARHLVDLPSVGDIEWLTESELIEAYKRQYARGEQADVETGATSGRRTLERARVVDLLVLDELFSVRGQPYTGQAGRAIGAILYERFESGRLTLIASNEPDGAPSLQDVGRLAAKVFDDRVASRLEGCTDVVRAWGDDLRRRR